MIILCASFICVLRVEQSRSSLGLESQGKIQHNPPRKCVTRLSKYFAFRELARTAIELTARRCEKGQALESFSSKFQLAGLATSVCLQGNCFIFQYFNNFQHSLKWWKGFPSTSRKGYLKPPMGCWSWTLPGTGKARSGGRSLEIDPRHSPHIPRFAFPPPLHTPQFTMAGKNLQDCNSLINLFRKSALLIHTRCAFGFVGWIRFISYQHKIQSHFSHNKMI